MFFDWNNPGNAERIPEDAVLVYEDGTSQAYCLAGHPVKAKANVVHLAKWFKDADEIYGFINDVGEAIGRRGLSVKERYYVPERGGYTLHVWTTTDNLWWWPCVLWGFKDVPRE